jgi:CDP-diacylglycerol--glycerol-3-phosphate 3-phosphatidyltransferase
MARLGAAVHRAGVHPDAITVAGLVMVGIAAVAIGRGQLQLGGVILLLSFPLDALDGAVARAMQRQGKFGEVLDSALDRYADGFIFAALSYYLATHNQPDIMLLALAAMMGSFVISYMRARAGEVDVKMKTGLFTRFERVITLLVILLIPTLLLPGLWVLAIGTNFTALQRLWVAYRVLNEREQEKTGRDQ